MTLTRRRARLVLLCARPEGATTQDAGPRASGAILVNLYRAGHLGRSPELSPTNVPRYRCHATPDAEREARGVLGLGGTP